MATASRAAVLMVLALAAVPGDVRPQPETASARAQLGRLLVERNCAMCHAVGQTGESPSPPAPPFRRLHQRMDVEALGEGLASGILTEHPAMPEFRFSPHEVTAIIHYLRSIQERQSS